MSCALTANIGLYTTSRLRDVPARITASVPRPEDGQAPPKRQFTTRSLFREEPPPLGIRLAGMPCGKDVMYGALRDHIRGGGRLWFSFAKGLFLRLYELL